jgi:polysaccharide biosynthesis/export protein
MTLKFTRIALMLPAAAVPLVLASCASPGLPNDGPASAAYAPGATQVVSPQPGSERLPYVLVDLSPQVVETARAFAAPQSGGSGLLGARRAPTDLVVGVGDTVRVTIFEAATGGLFAPQGTALSKGNYVDIPDQEVLRNGMVNVPYAGAVRAAGRRPADIARDVESRLMNRAIEPSVVVSVINRRSNLTTVVGEVNQPGRIPLTPNGDRILDVIAAAGGPKFPDYETVVKLQRGGRQTEARLSGITRNPAANAYVAPGDVLYLERDQRGFMVFGALGIPAFTGVSRLNVPLTPGIARSALFTFDKDQLSLAEGLAKAGGLLPDRADPYSIVLYRRERRDTLARMGADVSAWPATAPVPTVYRLNIREPSGYFLAQKFPLQDDDLVYVAQSPVNDVLQISAIVRDLSATVFGVRESAGVGGLP